MGPAYENKKKCLVNCLKKVNKNIKIELIPNGDRLQVAGVVLHYRPQGELDYTSERMEFDGLIREAAVTMARAAATEGATLE